MDTKVCPKCSKEFPLTPEFFYRYPNGSFLSSCRTCAKEYQRAYHQANREKVSLRHHRYYEQNKEKVKKAVADYRKANKDKIAEYFYRNRMRKKEYSRRYYREHRAEKIAAVGRWYQANSQRVKERMSLWRQNNYKKVLQQSRLWRKANREKRKECMRLWRQRNKDRGVVYSARRRAYKAKTGGTFTPEDIAKLLKGQKGRCWWCQCKLNGIYHVDHRVPLSKGGSNAPENLVISCPHCNQAKYNKLPSEWIGRLL